MSLYNFVLNLEKAYTDFMEKTLGHVGAVRFEDFSSIIFSLIAGWLICFFMMALTVPDQKRTYSDSMDKILLIEMPDKNNEGESFLAIRRPKNYKDKLELLIATTWHTFFGLKKVNLHDARKMTIIFAILSIIVALFLLMSLMFAWTVLHETPRPRG